MKFIIAITLLIVGFAYANADDSNDVSKYVNRAINPAMRKLGRVNAGEGNLGASINSMKTIAKGKLNKNTQFLLFFMI